MASSTQQHQQKCVGLLCLPQLCIFFWAIHGDEEKVVQHLYHHPVPLACQESIHCTESCFTLCSGHRKRGNCSHQFLEVLTYVALVFVLSEVLQQEYRAHIIHFKGLESPNRLQSSSDNRVLGFSEQCIIHILLSLYDVFH